MQFTIWTLIYSKPVLELYRGSQLFARYPNEESNIKNAKRLASKWNFPVNLKG